MTQPSDKTLHPALRLATASLLAKTNSGLAAQLSQSPFPFPGVDNYTVHSMAPHTAMIGTSGSGKTILFKHFISAVLPAAAEHGGLRYRAVVYDPKRELYPFLHGLGIPMSQIIVTHPFDSRSAAWNIAADFVEPAQIEELVEIIVPTDEKKSNDSSGEFFANTSRILFQDVIKGLNQIKPKNWDLIDVIETVSNRRNLKSVLKLTKSGRDAWDTYLRPLELDGEDKTALSILASLLTYIRPFESLAALWQHSDRQFSLEDWHVGSGILLLGADPSREKTLQRVNRLLMRRICQMLLSRNDERPVDLTWFFLDEVREAGNLQGLRQLMTEGRSKGARVIMGFQDMEGMYSLYDEHESEEMVGLCANRIYLHLDNPKTRKWASDYFSEEEYEKIQKTAGSSVGTTGNSASTSTSTGIQRSIELRANFLPVEFHDLALGNPTDGIPLFFGIPGRRNKYHFSSELAQRAVSFEDQSTQPKFDARPLGHQDPKYWTDVDFELIGLKKRGRHKLKKQQYREPPNHSIKGQTNERRSKSKKMVLGDL